MRLWQILFFKLFLYIKIIFFYYLKFIFNINISKQFKFINFFNFFKYFLNIKINTILIINIRCKWPDSEKTENVDDGPSLPCLSFPIFLGCIMAQVGLGWLVQAQITFFFLLDFFSFLYVSFYFCEPLTFFSLIYFLFI